MKYPHILKKYNLIKIRNGVRQGCSHFPLLLNSYVEKNIKELKRNRFGIEIKVGGMFNDLICGRYHKLTEQ